MGINKTYYRQCSHLILCVVRRNTSGILAAVKSDTNPACIVYGSSPAISKTCQVKTQTPEILAPAFKQENFGEG